MSPQEMTDLADRLMIAGASLLEDLHPSLVAGESERDMARAKADALSSAAERLNILARCALVLVDITADQNVTA